MKNINSWLKPSVTVIWIWNKSYVRALSFREEYHLLLTLAIVTVIWIDFKSFSEEHQSLVETECDCDLNLDKSYYVCARPSEKNTTCCWHWALWLWFELTSSHSMKNINSWLKPSVTVIWIWTSKSYGLVLQRRIPLVVDTGNGWTCDLNWPSHSMNNNINSLVETKCDCDLNLDPAPQRRIILCLNQLQYDFWLELDKSFIWSTLWDRGNTQLNGNYP